MVDALSLADGLDDSAIAQRLGCDRSAFSNYLNGKRKLPYSTVVAIWREFGAEPAWLLAGDARNNSEPFQAKLNALLKSKPQERKGRPRK
jgi:transcriptional regulator with XRE-family HTH domain